MIKLFWHYFNQTSEELFKNVLLNFLIKYYHTNTEQLHNNYKWILKLNWFLELRWTINK